MDMYADDLKAAGDFLVGLNELCEATKISVSAHDEGIALWHDGDIIGHVGMFVGGQLTFRIYGEKEEAR